MSRWGSREQFEQALLKALSLDLPYPGVQQETGIEAAVLLLFSWSGHGPDRDPSLLFLLRTDTVDRHKGQIAFPGGGCEDCDFAYHGDGFIQTALRETREEVGIESDCIRVLGRLPTLSTLTGFRVTPVVGVLLTPREQVSLRLDAYEVADAFWLSASRLTNPAVFREEFFHVGESRHRTDVYRVDEHRIWGITAAILKNLLARLALVQ